MAARGGSASQNLWASRVDLKRAYLKENVRVSDDLLNALMAEELISNNERNEIFGLVIKANRLNKLIDICRCKGPDSFQKFCNGLKSAGMSFVVEELTQVQELMKVEEECQGSLTVSLLSGVAIGGRGGTSPPPSDDTLNSARGPHHESGLSDGESDDNSKRDSALSVFIYTVVISIFTAYRSFYDHVEDQIKAFISSVFGTEVGRIKFVVSETKEPLKPPFLYPNVAGTKQQKTRPKKTEVQIGTNSFVEFLFLKANKDLFYENEAILHSSIAEFLHIKKEHIRLKVESGCCIVVASMPGDAFIRLLVAISRSEPQLVGLLQKDMGPVLIRIGNLPHFSFSNFSERKAACQLHSSTFNVQRSTLNVQRSSSSDQQKAILCPILEISETFVPMPETLQTELNNVSSFSELQEFLTRLCGQQRLLKDDYKELLDKLGGKSLVEAKDLVEKCEAIKRESLTSRSDDYKGKFVSSLDTKPLLDCLDILRQNGWLTEDLGTELRAKERLKLCVLDRKAENMSEVLKPLVDAAKHSKEFKERLLDEAKKVQEFVDDLDRQLQFFVNLRFPRVSKRWERLFKSLEGEKHVKIIVAGAVSVGKSSFINLLFGGKDFKLPVSDRPATSCICEIVYGKEKKAEVYWDKSLKKSPNPEQILIDQLAEYISYDSELIEESEGLQIEKVVLYSPSELLESGICIIDTPGIASGANRLKDYIRDYLSDAAAFIYILAPTSVDIGTLKPLFKAEKSLEGSDEIFAMSSKRPNIFVVNKWDTVVSKEERSKRQSQITEEIETVMSSVKEAGGHPVIWFSTNEAEAHLKAKYKADCLDSFVTKLGDMMPVAIKYAVHVQAKFLLGVMAEIRYHLRRYLCKGLDLKQAPNVDRQKFKNVCKNKVGELRSCLEVQKKEVDKTCKQLLKRQQELSRSLEAYLHNKKLQNKVISSWIETEVDDVVERADKQGSAKSQLQSLISETHTVIEQKIKTLIVDKWQENEPIIGQVQTEFQEAFDKAGQVISEKIQEVRSVVQDSLSSMDSMFTGWLTEVKDVRVSGRKIVFSYPFQPLSYALFLIGIGILIEELKHMTGLNKFRSYPKAEVVFLTTWYFENALKKKVCDSYIKDRLNLQGNTAEWIKRAEELVSGVEEEILEKDDGRTREDLLKVYEPMHERGAKIMSSLIEWGLDSETIPHKKVDSTLIERSKIVAEGRFGKIYEFKDQLPAKKFAKIYRERDGKHEFLLVDTLNEFSSLSALDHPNIVKASYFAVNKENISTVFMTVFEARACQSLATWLQTDSHVPRLQRGTNESAETERLASILSKQLASAIAFIHSKNALHSCLEPMNVLIEETDQEPGKVGFSIKIYDIRSLLPTHFKQYFAETKYIAPEVQTSKIFTFSGDVYSLGHVLWEMWNGLNFEDPSTTAGVFEYDSTIKKCLARNPLERPTASLVESTLVLI